MMRILGIDPGSESTGYGIIQTDGSRHTALLFGAIKTSSLQPFAARLFKIHSELTLILENQVVNAVAVEGVFHARNIQSALKLGHARGVVLLVAAQHQLPVFEYSPLEVKSALVGYGRAEKCQIQSMVRFLLRLPDVPSPDDAADALALAICHCHHLGAKAQPFSLCDAG